MAKPTLAPSEDCGFKQLCLAERALRACPGANTKQQCGQQREDWAERRSVSSREPSVSTSVITVISASGKAPIRQDQSSRPISGAPE